MYDFNAYKLYLRVVAWFLRAPIHNDWLKVLSTPIDFIQGLLLAFVDATSYDMLFNSQIVYLEHVLNDQFTGVPDIYIENTFLPPLYLYNKVEAQPPFHIRNKVEAQPPVYMRNKAEYDSANQYVVHCSAALAGDLIAIIALIEMYNLAGMNYEILFDL